MKIWLRYIQSIKRNCASPRNAVRDLAYWRNNLFASTIIYLLPFCLIALLPGLYWSIITAQYVLILTDIVTLTGIVMIAFVPGISIPTRKIIFITCVYLLSCVMLHYIGLYGPGLLFMLTACIFCILIFPTKKVYWSAFLNTFICLLFGLLAFLQLLPWPDELRNSPGAWIAVSSNLVFLSFLSVALIPRLFNGLQETIQKEKRLQQELSLEQRSLQQAMEMLEQKNEELEQFGYVVSHDLQEPLRMIASFLTLLEKKYKPLIDDNGKQYIHFAVDGAQRMRQLIMDLLEFSRVGRLEENLEKVELNELIKEIISLYKKQIEEIDAVIRIENLQPLLTYKTPLRQIFLNLLGNALKYHKKEGQPEITISADESATHWQFTVADNGIGIEAANFERIFSIFQRIHPKNEYPGTGIGLAIVKKIVEKLGGKVWVNSVEAKGSAFCFTIKKQQAFGSVK